MPRSLACPRAAVALALGVLLAAAQDLAYVPPKGTYDTPASFFRPLKAVGETYEYNLTAPVTNGYQRQMRLKVIGLENVNRLTTLKDSVKQGDDAERARVEAQQAKNPGSTGGQLGALLGKLNPLMAKEVDRQKEVAKDDLVIKIVETGSPDDTPTAAIAEVRVPPGQIGGSIFGVKVNNKVRVAVTSDERRFQPARADRAASPQEHVLRPGRRPNAGVQRRRLGRGRDGRCQQGHRHLRQRRQAGRRQLQGALLPAAVRPPWRSSAATCSSCPQPPRCRSAPVPACSAPTSVMSRSARRPMA